MKSILKKLPLLLSILFSIKVFAQVPEKYSGVMLQGFYWDSFADTKWAHLQSQADELSHYFDLIWVPQSGKCLETHNTMGYLPYYYFNQDSSFGTERELRAMISTFKDSQTGIIADVVVNHHNTNGWFGFPKETYEGKEYQFLTTDVVANDDGGLAKKEADRLGLSLSSRNDEGEDFGGARDLDHNSANVQTIVKAYCKYLIDDLGYTGFRYDMVKGFSGTHVADYNGYANPSFSVGEYWDNDYDKVVGWINATSKTSSAFDFPLKYRINDAFNGGNWGALVNKGIAGDPEMSRWAVTFTDNHDTYQKNDKLVNNVLAANAFILALPGTPCVFLPHWKNHKKAIKKMIFARKAAGITNESSIVRQESLDGGYVTTVQGNNAQIMVISGFPSVDTRGFEPVSVGTADDPNYAFYISGINPRLKYEEKPFVYVEVPASWTQVFVHAWDNASNNYSGGNWPGENIASRYVGDAANGNKIYRWVYAGNLTTMPDNIIFHDYGGGDDHQTADLKFVNGGYYRFISKAGNSVGYAPGYVVTPTVRLVDREFVQDRISTVCMPFSLDHEEISNVNGTFYEFSSADEQGILRFSPAQSVKAYMPYVFVSKENGQPFSVLINRIAESGSPQSVTKGSFSFKGTMERAPLVSGGGKTYYGYKASDGTFVQAGKTKGVSADPYRCYFYTSSSSAKPMGIVFEGKADGINKINEKSPACKKIYGIDGVRINENAIKRGVCIIDGQKILKK